MNKEIIIGFIGVMIGYIIIRALLRYKKPEKDMLTDILSNDKYKVKGQWDK